MFKSRKKPKPPNQRESLQPSLPARKNTELPPAWSQSSQLDLIRFRQDSDLISQDLPMNLDHLREWVVEFLRLSELKLLDSRDAGEVARSLHNLDRKYKSSKGQKFRASIHDLLDQVRRAYVSGSIPRAAHVPLHLLSYYKESGHLDKGVEFWNWLSRQGDAPLSPIFVGAAIELLAVYGAGIRQCEDIYERTLDQQDDIASQYQLQPGAILPDRSKAITIKGTSLGLLQGILSARLFYGQWQASYLALDTAFRLRPSQVVSRVLDLFVYERPIFEALQVFFMFCRGGNRVSDATLAAVLRNLKKIIDHVSDSTSKINAVRAMIQVIEAYVRSAGLLNSIHLNILARAIVSAMPPTMPTKLSVDAEYLTKTVIDLFTQLLGYFSKHGVAPNQVTFDGTIPVALALGYLSLGRALFDDMVTLGLSPHEGLAQSLMEAAGSSRDPDLLKAAWTCACDINRSDAGKSPKFRSWQTMTLAARRCGLDSFAENQLNLLGPQSSLRAKLTAKAVQKDSLEPTILAEAKPNSPKTEDAQKLEDLCAGVFAVIDRVKDLRPGSYSTFDERLIEEGNSLAWPNPAEESWQRRLYDELTLEKGPRKSNAAAKEPSTIKETIAVGDTGIEFDSLRYSNWKTTNSLLIQAEAFEQRLQASTDAAIRDRRAFPQQIGSNTTGNTAGARYPVTVEQFQAYQQDVRNERAKATTEEEWRNRILRLRNVEYTSQAYTTTARQA
ncbi:MAG: hypothetical protein Q9182_002187 [Xanthomendoza sp. 2 TL-2023]